MSDAEASSAPQPARRTGRRLRQRLGAVAVAFALLCALATFFMLSGLTPLVIDDRAALAIFIANVVSLIVVIALVVVEGWSHYDLYDNPAPTGIALGRVIPFLRRHLGEAAISHGAKAAA